MTEEYTGDAYGVGQGYTNKWRTHEGYKRNIADFSPFQLLSLEPLPNTLESSTTLQDGKSDSKLSCGGR